MSFLADQIDAEDSSHSLLSRRQSEMGSSRYVFESGVYMSSFAATVFVAALVTLGVLLLTLVVSLTVMLNSCQSRNSGVIQHSETSDEYGYCSVFAFHAELNNLEAHDFPATCKHYSLAYGNEGRFFRELNLTVQLAESYFSTVEVSGDSLDAVLMDIDEMLPGIADYNNSARDWRKHVEDGRSASMLVLRLFLELQSSGWSVILFTRKHLKYKNDTVESLISAGYSGWSSLIMRSDDELPLESWEYISNIRLQLLEKRYRIASVISSRMDAFRGSHLGQRNFKLANPAYYNLPITARS